MKLGNFYKKLVMIFCGICLLNVVSLAECDHDFKWAKNETKHYYSCEDCGYTTESGEHDFKWAKNEDNHYYSCEVCGYTTESGEHDFKWAKNEDNHYYSCEVCGYTTESGEHDFKWAKNSKKHYKSCEDCGYTTESGEHDFDWAKNEDNHYYSCEDCGYTTESGEHDFKWAKSAKKHYKSCEVCGYTTESGEHDFDWAKNEDNHYYSCEVCGYTTESGEHDFDWAKNATKHYKSCEECGYTAETGDHDFVNDKCTVCEYKKGSTISYNTPSTIKAAPASGRTIDSTDFIVLTIEDVDGVDYVEYKWSTKTDYTKQNKHGVTTTKVYTSSVGTRREGQYTLDVRVTDERGYVETATFTYKLRNDDDDDECSHTYNGWKSNSTYHWKECTKCEEETSKTVHTFSGSKCTVCSYRKSSSGGSSSSGGGSGSSSTKGAPEIIVSPKDGSTVEFGDRIKITAEDEDGIEYVEYYWNKESATKRYDAEFSIKVPSKEGKNNLYIRAKDKDGKRGSYEKFTFDVEENNYPGNSDVKGKLNKNIKELRVEIGNVDDRIVYEPGEEIQYYVDYYNGTSSKISDAKIIVEVPSSKFEIANVEDGTKTTKKATWNIGSIKSGEDGRVYFTMKYDEDKDLDNDLIFNVEAKIYKSSKEQDSSFTRNMIYSESSKAQDDHIAYVSGYPDGRVKPDGTITRAEMATMIARMAGIDVNNYIYRNAFSDVSVDFWGAGAIQACVDNGLVEAYSYGRFEPELPATRGMISYAIAKLLGIEDVEPIYIDATDTEDSSNMIAVEQMIRLNIIEGYSDGKAKPDKAITRAEAMVIINKYLFRGELLSDDEDLPYYGAPVHGFRQFTDLPLDHWAYNHIMEATCDHEYVRNHDGNEIIKY